MIETPRIRPAMRGKNRFRHGFLLPRLVISVEPSLAIVIDWRKRRNQILGPG